MLHNLKIVVGSLVLLITNTLYGQTMPSSSGQIIFNETGFGDWDMPDASNRATDMANQKCSPNQALKVSKWSYRYTGRSDGPYNVMAAGADFTCATSSTRLMTETIEVLADITNSNCEVASVAGTTFEYSCTSSRNGRIASFKINTNYRNPALNGVMLEGAKGLDYLQPNISEKEIKKFMFKVSEVSLKYFQAADSRTTWNFLIHQGAILFQDSNAFLTEFGQPDQTSIAFVEMSRKIGLRIYIGLAG
jgi:hypothetical protein